MVCCSGSIIILASVGGAKGHTCVHTYTCEASYPDHPIQCFSALICMWQFACITGMLDCYWHTLPSRISSSNFTLACLISPSASPAWPQNGADFLNNAHQAESRSSTNYNINSLTNSTCSLSSSASLFIASSTRSAWSCAKNEILVKNTHKAQIKAHDLFF